jgi:hypothetical protein
MNPDQQLLDVALRSWKQNVDRVDAFFNDLTDHQLQQRVAPGRNRLVYLLGHLAAVHDAMRPLLGIGAKLHPELEAPFLANPDGAVPSALTGTELGRMSREINDALWTAFNRWTPAQWLERHTSVSPEDFAKEPHRNRFSVLLSRSAHVQFHYGQMVLTKPKTSNE